MLNAMVMNELMTVARSHDGMLRATDVVEFAKDPKSQLHSRFEWDDGNAAHYWRLSQARQLIRIVMELHPIDEQPMRAFVSLSADRVTGGGYRSLHSVLDNELLAAIMLRDALAELRRFRVKYNRLKSLAPVMAVIEKLEQEADGAQLAKAV